jgi:DTW domain-containing protein YfiP
MCEFINPFDTNTKFVILMHPKEFKKVKNSTGRFTHLSLKNSELFVGIDFTNHNEVNNIISTHNSFILYPSGDAIDLSSTNPLSDPNNKKQMAIFIIDSTWSCAKNIVKHSKNLHKLNYLSFSSSKLSNYRIKEQPQEHCLSTIESTLEVLELLNGWGVENINQNSFENFLKPFDKMIEYQLSCIKESDANTTRFKLRK